MNCPVSKWSELTSYNTTSYVQFSECLSNNFNNNLQFWRHMRHSWLLDCEFNHSHLTSLLQFTKAQFRAKINKIDRCAGVALVRVVDISQKNGNKSETGLSTLRLFSSVAKNELPMTADQLSMQSAGLCPTSSYFCLARP